MIQFKDINLEIKDIDNSSRRVKIALSRFGNVDSDNDVIIKGAFSKSIQERGPDSGSNRKIKFLRYHDWEHQIGKFISLEETHDYLIGDVILGRSTKGNDALLDYEDGIITEHSVGFEPVIDKVFIREDGVKELREVILWEGSAVTFGANSETPPMHVGKGNKSEYLEKLNKKMNTLISALKNGKGTDERLFDIEMGLKVLQKQYNSLFDEQSFKNTVSIEPKVKQVDATKMFYLNLLKS